MFSKIKLRYLNLTIELQVQQLMTSSALIMSELQYYTRD